MRCARLITLGIMLAVAATDVAAGPYEVVAIYKPSGSGDPKAIEIKVAAGAVLPDRTTTSRLDRVVIRFRRDGLGAVTTGTFRNFAIATSDGECVRAAVCTSVCPMPVGIAAMRAMKTTRTTRRKPSTRSHCLRSSNASMRPCSV